MSIIVFVAAYVVAVIAPTWRWFWTVAGVYAFGLVWMFLTLFEVIPPQVSNLYFVAALSPAWIGGAGGLLVRAYTLQRPKMTLQERIIYSGIGLVAFAAIAFLLG